MMSRPEPAEWPAFEIDINADQSGVDGQPCNRRGPITFAGMWHDRTQYPRLQRAICTRSATAAATSSALFCALFPSGRNTLSSKPTRVW